MRSSRLTIISIFVVFAVVALIGWHNKHSLEEKSQPAAGVTIDNPILRSVPQRQDVGWAKAVNTSSGVLIQASVKISIKDTQKGESK